MSWQLYWVKNSKKIEDEYKLKLKLANQEIDELKSALKYIESDYQKEKYKL